MLLCLGSSLTASAENYFQIGSYTIDSSNYQNATTRLRQKGILNSGEVIYDAQSHTLHLVGASINEQVTILRDMVIIAWNSLQMTHASGDYSLEIDANVIFQAGHPDDALTIGDIAVINGGKLTLRNSHISMPYTGNNQALIRGGGSNSDLYIDNCYIYFGSRSSYSHSHIFGFNYVNFQNVTVEGSSDRYDTSDQELKDNNGLIKGAYTISPAVPFTEPTGTELFRICGHKITANNYKKLGQIVYPHIRDTTNISYDRSSNKLTLNGVSISSYSSRSGYENALYTTSSGIKEIEITNTCCFNNSRSSATPSISLDRATDISGDTMKVQNGIKLGSHLTLHDGLNLTIGNYDYNEINGTGIRGNNVNSRLTIGKVHLKIQASSEGAIRQMCYMDIDELTTWQGNYTYNSSAKAVTAIGSNISYKGEVKTKVNKPADFFMAGININEDNKDNVSDLASQVLASGSIEYEYWNNRIILTDAHFRSGLTESALDIRTPLTIIVRGNCQIPVISNGTKRSSICIQAPVNIIGDGALHLSSITVFDSEALHVYDCALKFDTDYGSVAYIARSGNGAPVLTFDNVELGFAADASRNHIDAGFAECSFANMNMTSNYNAYSYDPANGLCYANMTCKEAAEFMRNNNSELLFAIGNFRVHENMTPTLDMRMPDIMTNGNVVSYNADSKGLSIYGAGSEEAIPTLEIFSPISVNLYQVLVGANAVGQSLIISANTKALINSSTYAGMEGIIYVDNANLTLMNSEFSFLTENAARIEGVNGATLTLQQNHITFAADANGHICSFRSVDFIDQNTDDIIYNAISGQLLKDGALLTEEWTLETGSGKDYSLGTITIGSGYRSVVVHRKDFPMLRDLAAPILERGAIYYDEGAKAIVLDNVQVDEIYIYNVTDTICSFKIKGTNNISFFYSQNLYVIYLKNEDGVWVAEDFRQTFEGADGHVDENILHVGYMETRSQDIFFRNMTFIGTDESDRHYIDPDGYVLRGEGTWDSVTSDSLTFDNCNVHLPAVSQSSVADYQRVLWTNCNVVEPEGLYYDRTSHRWSLNMSGNTYHGEVIIEANMHELVEGVENVSGENDRASKQIRNGQLFIIRDQHAYDALGRLME